MANTEVSDEILDMFDIPNEKKSDDDFSSISNSDAKPDFESLADDMGDRLSGMDVKVPEVEESKDKKAEVSNPPQEDSQEASESKTKSDSEEEEQPDKDSKKKEDFAENIIRDELNKTSEPDLDLDGIFDDNEGNNSEDVESNIEAEGSDESEDSDDIEEDQNNDSSDSDDEETSQEPQASHTAESPISSEQSPETASSEEDDEGSKKALGQVGQRRVQDQTVEISTNKKFKWRLSPPTDKYSHFYAEKESALLDLLPGGIVPFDSYNRELRKARVDLTIRSYNVHEIHARMIEVQGWRDRVGEIMLHVNDQYYMWDRYIDLFHGLLARVEYDKPAVKQEGVNYEHMRDLEMYHQKLKALHSSAGMVLKNLEAAWETLNRQVTIGLKEYREPERISRSSDSRPSSKNVKPTAEEDFAGFDQLEEGATATPKKQGPQYVDWDD